MSVLRSVLPMLICWAAVSGCSGKAGRQKTVPVTGTVLYRSQPVEGAKVVFTSTEKSVPPAAGVTDQDGRFRLTTYDPGDGAVPAMFTVTIVKSIASASGPPANETMEQAAERAKQQPKGKASSKTLSALPDKYTDPARSGLQYTVEQGKDNDFKIELKD